MIIDVFYWIMYVFYLIYIKIYTFSSFFLGAQKYIPYSNIIHFIINLGR